MLLYMVKPKIGANDISGIHWIYEHVITNKLKNLINREKLSGYEFWPIINFKNKEAFDDVNQLYIAGVLSPMSNQAKIVKVKNIKQCECRKRGYTLEDFPIYDRSSLHNVTDFNKTHEWLGGAIGTWQLVIVTKRVYDLFIREKIRGVRFEPVKVVG